MRRPVLAGASLAISMLLGLFTSHAAPAEHVDTEEPLAEEAYQFPRIPPEGRVSVGYRTFDLSGSASVEEYEYPHSSVTLGGELRVFSFPHRLHLDLDYKNEKDYFGDISYAYKDIVLFRGINRTLFHNLGTITLFDLDPTTPSPGVDVKDAGDKYGTKSSLNNFFLRLKAPDFPFHVYLDGGYIKKDGTIQQISLLGSAFFNDIKRSSQPRDINWQTTNITFGSNSHLGPLEVDFAHGEKRFNVQGNNVLSYSYATAEIPPEVVRPAGTFLHNLTPELKSSSNTLKMHTSYTGGLVASATFSKTDKENTDSGAKADYFVGAGEVTWMPMPKLTLIVKYRHREADFDNLQSITITDLSNPSTHYTYPVKPSISSVSDSVSSTMRYRLATGVTLRAEYSYDSIRRADAEAWNMPGSTQRNTVSLSTDMRVAKGLTLKAKYTHKEIDNPAYNNEPNRSDEGRISITWLPVPKISALASFSIAKEKRNDLVFLDENEDRIRDALNRSLRKERFLGSLTVLLIKDLSLTASYTYLQNRITQDIAFTSDVFPYPPVVDGGVPYRDMAHVYALDIGYMPKGNLSLHAGASYMTSTATFLPSSIDLTQPVSISSFSDVKIRETVCTLSGEYRFKGGYSLGLRYRYSKLDDVLDNLNSDIKDGTAHIIAVTVSKRW